MDTKFAKKDEWTIVLDFLPHGRPGMKRSEPVAHVVGEEWFSLLEVIVREGVTLKSEDRVYIGEQKREQVKYIVGKIELNKLTVAARDMLPDVINKIIEKNPEKFVGFFNKAGQLTTRLHSLELLPGVGKKHLWAILDARKIKPFESFEDIKNRIKLLPDPMAMIARRIMDELENKDKYRIFVPSIEKKRF